MKDKEYYLALEEQALEQDSMKMALDAVGLGVLVLAKKHRDVIEGTNATAAMKSLEIVHKIRGDFAVADQDNRPVEINFSWGDEGKPIVGKPTEVTD